MKKLLTLIVCICCVFTVIAVLPVHGEADIYDKVLRLHVVANSDSEADQELKLCVRDRILAVTQALGSDCTSLEEARELIEAELDTLELAAAEEIARQGFSYAVEVKLTEEQYPTKQYASLCFPAGKYLSLQVLIGDAVGQNWWCVLFPPLCLDAASKSNEDAFISVGFTAEQYKIITETEEPTYRARFKILELIEGTQSGLPWDLN